MILTCSSCGARFELDASKLGPGGRKVRCGRCGHTWRQTAEPVPQDAAEAAAAIEPIPRLQEFDEARRRRSLEAAAEPAPPRRVGRGGLFGWLGFLLVLLLLAAGLWFGSPVIVAHLPAAARLYQAVGIGVELPGEGLELREVTHVRRVVNGEAMLLVEGTIVNVSDKTRSLPVLRASIVNAEGQRIEEWRFEAAASSLPPGGVTTFQTQAKDPPRDGQLDLDFEARAD